MIHYNPNFIHWRFNFNPASLLTEVYACQTAADGQTQYLAEPVNFKFKEYKPGHPVIPTFYIEDFTQYAKDVYERADHAGIKPNYESVAEGKLSAMEEHLSDMRRLVFKDA